MRSSSPMLSVCSPRILSMKLADDCFDAPSPERSAPAPLPLALESACLPSSTRCFFSSCSHVRITQRGQGTGRHFPCEKRKKCGGEVMSNCHKPFRSRASAVRTLCAAVYVCTMHEKRKAPPARVRNFNSYQCLCLFVTGMVCTGGAGLFLFHLFPSLDA